jgi:hypothetical protein
MRQWTPVWVILATILESAYLCLSKGGACEKHEEGPNLIATIYARE